MSATAVDNLGALGAALVEFGGRTGVVLLLASLALLLFIGVVVRLRHIPKPSAEPVGLIAPGPSEHDDARAVAESDTEPVERWDAVPEPAVPASPAAWLARIRLAEERNDTAALPALYLALAQNEIARGDIDSGADHLRSCIRTAAKARNAGAEAEARIELADLARAAGDLTTACEHWQIARGLFLKLERRKDLAGTEDMMQRHGCPTDWVLTDF